MGVDALLSSCLGCPACIVLLGILFNFTNSHTNAFFLLFSSLALIIFALKSHIIAHIDTPPQHITCYAIFAVSSLFFQTQFVLHQSSCSILFLDARNQRDICLLKRSIQHPLSVCFFKTPAVTMKL